MGSNVLSSNSYSGAQAPGSGVSTDDLVPYGAGPQLQSRSYAQNQRGAVSRDVGAPNGSPITAARDPRTHAPVIFEDLQPDTIVSIRGVGDMAYASARQAGFVSAPQAPQPPFAPPQGQPEEQQEEKPEVHPDLQVEAMEPEAEAAMVAINSSVAAGTSLEALAELACGAEDISERLVSAAAGQAGVEPEVLLAEVRTARAGFTAQAEKRIHETLGPAFDADDFWRWAWSENAGALNDAVTAQVTKGNTRGYAALAAKYGENLDKINPGAILSATLGDGITASKDARGRILLSQNGRVVGAWGDLYRAGSLKLSAAT